MNKLDSMFSCSSKELTFLCSLIGGSSIFGIKDPFLGLSDEDIKKEWDVVRDSLSKKKFITINPDDSIILDKTVSTVLTACCFCDMCVIVNYSSLNGESIDHCFYISQYLAVEMMVIYKEEDILCSFGVLPDSGSIYDRVQDIMHVDDHINTQGKSGTIKESTLSQVKKLLNSSDTEKAHSLLESAGFESADAKAISNALLAPQSHKVFVVMKFKDDAGGDASGFALLKGEKGIWKLNSLIMEEESWVEITPYNNEHLNKDILLEISDISSIYSPVIKEKA
ncbi:MAG: hypothetical protein ACOYWZ_19290 [Bacillota bacterium]